MERNSGEKDNDYHGRSGVWVGMWATSFPPSLCLVFFFFFFTIVSNGVDRMRLPCSALNVKVVRKSKQARTKRQEKPMSHVCSDRSSLSSSFLLVLLCHVSGVETALSGKANDWRNWEHVVLDLFSNLKNSKDTRVSFGEPLG